VSQGQAQWRSFISASGGRKTSVQPALQQEAQGGGHGARHRQTSVMETGFAWGSSLPGAAWLLRSGLEAARRRPGRSTLRCVSKPTASASAHLLAAASPWAVVPSRAIPPATRHAETPSGGGQCVWRSVARRSRREAQGRLKCSASEARWLQVLTSTPKKLFIYFSLYCRSGSFLILDDFQSG
jgi:hypothetical protein